MLSSLYKLLTTAAIVAIAGVVIFAYYNFTQQQRKVAQLEEEKKTLELVVDRLGAERRVAEILVTGQRIDNGVKETTLLFVEYARDGSALPPRQFTVRGDNVHIDGKVIRFDRHFVKEGDPLRGKSIALFTKIYGDAQTPESATPIDTPGQIPDQYRGADPKVTAFEQTLWQNFWKLAEDETFRNTHGVRLAWGEGAWGPFQPDRLYTATLEADGGLTITSQPLKPIYLQALKSATTRPQ